MPYTAEYMTTPETRQTSQEWVWRLVRANEEVVEMQRVFMDDEWIACTIARKAIVSGWREIQALR
jgi:hypothetical protein